MMEGAAFPDGADGGPGPLVGRAEQESPVSTAATPLEPAGKVRGRPSRRDREGFGCFWQQGGVIVRQAWCLFGSPRRRLRVDQRDAFAACVFSVFRAPELQVERTAHPPAACRSATLLSASGQTSGGV